MNILTTSLHIGAQKPFKIIHMTDIHLAYADMRDGERKVILAKQRLPLFPHAAEMLKAADQLAKELDAPIFCTGDLIDFISSENLDRAKEFADNNDLFLTAGNHEFSLYVGGDHEDAPCRNQSLQKVQAIFKNDIRQASRVIEGVNFVGLDNGNHLFDEGQFAFLKEEVKKGLPIVLLLHIPLYQLELDRPYADAFTRTVFEYMRKEPLIKAMLGGHIHEDYEGTALDRIPLWTTDGTSLRVFEIT